MLKLFGYLGLLLVVFFFLLVFEIYLFLPNEESKVNSTCVSGSMGPFIPNGFTCDESAPLYVPANGRQFCCAPRDGCRAGVGTHLSHFSDL